MLDRLRFAKADAMLNLISNYVQVSSSLYFKNVHVAYCTSMLRMYNLQGEYTKALKYASKKLDLLETIREDTGQASQKLCSAYTEKAMALIGTGHFSEEEILPMLQTSTKIRIALPGYQRTQLFNALRCEGTLYKKMGRLKEAEACYLKAYEDRVAELGDEKLHTNIRFVS